MTVEGERGQWDHDTQVSSDGDRGEHRGDRQGESEAKSEGWSGGSEGESTEETEEDGVTKGEPGRSRDTLTTSPWGTQESGTGGLRVGAQADGSDARKSPSAAANEAETRGRHRARPGQGENDRGRREQRTEIPLCDRRRGGDAGIP